MTTNIRTEYDAIVIGGGAGGGVVACQLAEAGHHVLLLERGRNLAYKDVPRDHVRNHRQTIYADNTTADYQSHPRVVVDMQGREHIVHPQHGGYMNNAMTLGGGTRVYGAQAWRFHPIDFKMASTYGIPKGSSLADWPITYDELAPYYEQAEWEIGVSGDHATSLPAWNRRKPYPMPAFPPSKSSINLKKAADALGWATQPVPLLISTQPFGGRPACIRCGNCVGQACPSDGKNGSQNTVIPRGLATGNLTMLLETNAERIDTDDRGKVIGVTFVKLVNGQLERHTVRAKRVIVSAAAIETARLLLNSRSKHHPKGLGNHSDHVGRHLQGHVYTGAHAILHDVVYDGDGPGVSICTLKFSHGNPGIVGGGLLANEFLKTPLKFWGEAPPDQPRWGIGMKQYMRHAFTRAEHIQGPIQDTPSPDGRVTVDDKVRDRFGNPVAKLSGTTHPASIDSAMFLHERAREWMQALDPVRMWAFKPALGLTGGQHQAGTARMSKDPKDGVTNEWGRVHGHDNLYVADGSLHVTNGGFNPVLTIFALAYRVADGIKKQG
jgi:choline dehydrogenase-like flavoprotein